MGAKGVSSIGPGSQVTGQAWGWCGGECGPSEDSECGAAYEGGEHAELSFSQLSLAPSTVAGAQLSNVYRVHAKTRASKTARKCTWKSKASTSATWEEKRKLQSEVKGLNRHLITCVGEKNLGMGKSHCNVGTSVNRECVQGETEGEGIAGETRGSETT